MNTKHRVDIEVLTYLTKHRVDMEVLTTEHSTLSGPWDPY